MCYYYHLQEIKNYQFWVASNDVRFASSFIKIRSPVPELKHVDIQVESKP
jgi:hypothetical protein